MNRCKKLRQQTVADKWKSVRNSGNFKRKVKKLAGDQLFVRASSRFLNSQQDNNATKSLEIYSEPIDLTVYSSRQSHIPAIPDGCLSHNSVSECDNADTSIALIQPNDADIPNSNTDCLDTINWETELLPENFPQINEQITVEITKDSLVTELQQWSADNSITHTSLSGLLKILNKNFPELKLKGDARTIMETPRTIHISSSPELGGQYWKYGIQRALVNALSKQPNEIDSLSLIVNVDGLPIYNSSSVEFWPILIRICELTHIPPLVVGVYCGRGNISYTRH